MNKRLFKERIQGSLAVVLAFALILTNMNMTAFAAEPQSTGNDRKIITKVKELDSSVLSQTLSVGSEESDIQFPESLTVAVTKQQDIETVTEEPTETESAEQNEKKETVAVTWKLDESASTSEVFDASKAGNTYVYISVIPGEYAVAEGVELPKITVTIGTDKERSEVIKALQSRIEALPTVSEFKAMADGTTVEGSKFSQKQMDVYNEAQDISDDIDKLSDEEQAQVDTEKLEKLFEYFNGQVEKSDAGWSILNGVLTITNADLLNNNTYKFGGWSGSSYNKGNLPPWFNKYEQYNKTIKKVKIECEPTTIGKCAFCHCTGLTEVVIPNSVITIGEYAFDNCQGLTEVVIPNRVTTIGKDAFYNCQGLTEVVISNRVTTIGESAFSNCTGLTEVVIPNSVITIGEYAFYNCQGLTEVVIPNSVTTIGEYAFEASGLTEVYICGNPKLGQAWKTLRGLSTVVYYWPSADNVKSYLNNYKQYYTEGKFFELNVDAEKDKTTEYGTDEVEYTATVGGLVSVLNTVTADSFIVTGKSTKDNTSVDSSVINVKSYDFDTKKLVISLKPGKTLDVLEGDCKYTFDVNIKGEFSGNTFDEKYKEVMSLAVTKKNPKNAEIASAKTISNEGGTTSFKIDAPVYGGEYDTDAKISVESDDSGFDSIVNCEDSSIEKSADNSYTLSLKTKNADSGHLTANGEIKIKIPVKESTDCEAYNMLLTVKVKGSPEAVKTGNIDAATDSITIKNTDTSCEYNIKKLNETEYAAEKWQQGTVVGGNVVFAGLDPADFYTVAVRYPENGDVKATLPSELLTSTLSAKPTEGEGYEIDYENETITPKDGYEILEDGAVCGENSIPIPIDSNKKYQVERKKKTDDKGNTIPASESTDITIPLRYDAPDTAVNEPERNNVTDVSIIINDTKKDYEYIVVPEEFSEDEIAEAWKQAKADNTAYTVVKDGDTLKFTQGFKKDDNGSVVLDDLKPSTSYKIFVRKKANKDENKFASSSVASNTVITKCSQIAPDDDIVNGTTDSSKNTSLTVVANGKAGYEYILVPKGTDASAVTEEQWKSNGKQVKPEDVSADGSVELTFDRTYNAKNEADKNIQPGTEYEILVRKPGDDTKMPSESKRSDVTYTKQVTPSLLEILNNTENSISIDYEKNIVIINGDVYEVYVPADGTTVPEQDTAATINGDKQSESIEPAVNGDRKIYVRKKALTKEDGVTIPASDWLAVEVKKIEQHKHDFGGDASNPEGWKIVKAATCEESGIKKRTCKECGYSETQEIPALGHDFDETNENAQFVWKAVTGNDGRVSGYTAELYFICKRDASHVLNAGQANVTSVIKDAAEDAEGSITYTAKLTYNGKEYSATKVSKLAKLVKLSDSSNTNAQSGIYVSVSRPDDAPVTKMEGVDLELAKSLMSESELRDYNDTSVATDVTVYLEVQNLGGAISSDEKTKIQEKVDSLVESVKGYETEDVKTCAQYLDLSMYKKVKTKKGSEAEQVVTSKITNTDRNITVSVEIPQSIKAVESGYTRIYYVIRVHGSEASVLDTKQSGNTLSFETDRFSSYAITYVDAKKKSSSGGSSGGAVIPVQTPGTTKIPPVTSTPDVTKAPSVTGTPDATKAPQVTGTPDTEQTQAPTKEPETTREPEQTTAPETTKEPEQTNRPETTAEPTLSPNNDTVVSKAEKQKNSLRLNAGLKVKQSEKKITVSWGNVKGADGYKVYVQYCGSNFKKKVFTNVKGGNKTTASISKINKKSIKQAKNYKVYVEAYKLVDGKKVSIGRTIKAHVSGLKNKKYTNVKKITLKKKSLKLKVGKTAYIKADTILEDKKKKPLSSRHARKLRYASSDSRIVTVSKKGKVKAVKRGKCVIYVYARNGYAKKVSVTVR